MKKSLLYKNENVISYTEFGDQTGYPILIHHGLIASIDDYHLFERLIGMGARLVCIARPGYGKSSPYLLQNLAEWADLAGAVIDELALSQFDVLGMSSGASYSYAVACRLPDKVRNIYIFSGIPALYDEKVLSYWPYEVKRNASLAQMEELAYELFFSNLSKEDLEKKDIKDSMMNNCFGVAQDLKLRSMDWGFRLHQVSQNVYMQHSKEDEAVPFMTACLTAKLLPNCQLDVREQGEHFSKDLLDDFIKIVIASNYESKRRFVQI